MPEKESKNTSENISNEQFDSMNHALSFSGLGRRAVITNMDRAAEKAYGESTNAQNTYESVLNDRIDRTVNDSRELIKSDPNLAVEFCDSHPISPWLRSVILGDITSDKETRYLGKTKTMAGKLASKILMKTDKRHGSAESNKVVDKLLKKKMFRGYAISDETFLNFLEWYNHAHVQRQNEVKDEIDYSKLKYIFQINRAVEEGWMPESVVSSRLNKLDEVSVAVDDGYGICGNKANNYSTYAQQNYLHNTILFNPISYKKASKVTSIIDDTYTHEATHAISDDSSAAKYEYLMGLAFGANNCGTIINEAVTEHIAQSLKSGSVDIIDPTIRAIVNEGFYSSERDLLNTLCNKGFEKIDIRNFINVYFEDNDTANKLGSKSARERLIWSLETAFPRKVIGKGKYKHKSVDAFNDFLVKKYDKKLK